MSGYPIRAVSKLTGLGIDTIRAWERRYGAVTPHRDDRGRVYSDADVARLRLLQQAVASGHTIGRIAQLAEGELRRLAEVRKAGVDAGIAAAHPALDTAAFNAALRTIDNAALDHEFSRLATVLPPISLVRDVLFPAVRQAGETWKRRRGGIALEHLISATIRHLLGAYLRLHARRDHRVRLLFATLSGERHEIGILGAAMLAASQRVAVSYVGPDVPAREIVEAVEQAGADVLVVGMTLTGSAPLLVRELRTLLRLLPPRVELWAGGAGAARHRALLTPRTLVLDDLDDYLHQVARVGGQQGIRV